MNDLDTRRKEIQLTCASKNQPLDFHLGVLEPLNKINVIFMRIGQNQYELLGIKLVEAVNILFKCMTSLGQPWPPINKHVWTYLKDRVYSKSKTITSNSITRLLGTIENLEKVESKDKPGKGKPKSVRKRKTAS